MTSSNGHSRRAFLQLTGLASLTLGLSACAPGATSGSSSGGGLKGVTLKMGMEAGGTLTAFYKKVAPEFTKATGIKVDMFEVPHDQMHEQFLNDALSGTGADVYAADQVWVPEFAKKGLIVNLDDRVSDSDRADFAGNTLETVTYDGSLYALPYLVHNTVLYYRTDLFEAAGISAPPTTWDEYRSHAKTLTGNGVYGTLVEGKQDGECAIRLQAFMQQTGGDIVDSDLKPTIDSKAGREAAELMRGLVADGSAPAGQLDLSDMTGQFMAGNLAMAPVWPFMFSLAEDPAQSKVAGKFAVALSPGNPDQVSTTFSWGYAISSSSKNQDAAWEWVKWATSTDIAARFGKETVQPVPRKSSVEQIGKDTELTERQRDAISVFAKSAEISSTMPMTPLYPQWQDAMAVAVSGIMSGQDADAVLKETQARMKSAA
jgi:multiple sugar transport system substrate-binding protein